MIGSETPRLFTPPARPLTPATSLGFEAIRFAEEVLGIDLLPWQRWLFIHALELDEAGSFRFRTVLVLVARQNGKTLWAQVLSLWRMYVDRCGLVLGTAQNLDVAEEVWAGAVELAEGTPELADEIASVDRAAGKKALRLVGKQRYKVQSANRRGGRGLSGDLVLLDELREHQTWDAWSAITKTTMARPRPQIVCLSNAGDDKSLVLNDLRAKALHALDGRGDSSLGIFEWSAPDGCDTGDRDLWGVANPSLGHTINIRAIEAAHETDAEHVFRTEVLCQRVDLGAVSPYPSWPDLSRKVEVAPGARVAFGVDVSWDRSTAWVAVAAEVDGRVHVELAANGLGTDWVPGWLSARLEKWSPVVVSWQQLGAPVSSLTAELVDSVGTSRAMPLGSADLGKACGMLYDLTSKGGLSHSGQDVLDDAAKFASVRPLGDAWVVDRKRSPLDVAPLLAVAAAVYGLRSYRPEPESKRRTGRLYAF